MSVPTAEWQAALKKVIRKAATQQGGLIQYAAGYAETGLYMSPGRERSVQAAYILSNLPGWKGPEAREAKALIQKVSKEF